jgi:hypothetical protein
MNTKNATIPELEGATNADARDPSQAWPFNTQTPALQKARSDALSPAVDQPADAAAVVDELQGKEPTLEEVQAEALRRSGMWFDVDPINPEELKALGYTADNMDEGTVKGIIPQDWAESLTGLRIALRDLDDGIPTKNREAVENAFRRLTKNQVQLQLFLRMRGLKV